MEKPTKMDDEQGYPYFRKPPYFLGKANPLVRRFLEHELHGASSPAEGSSTMDGCSTDRIFGVNFQCMGGLFAAPPPIASHNRSEAMSPPAHIAKSITWITLWFMDVIGRYNYNHGG